MFVVLSGGTDCYTCFDNCIQGDYDEEHPFPSPKWSMTIFLYFLLQFVISSIEDENNENFPFSVYVIKIQLWLARPPLALFSQFFNPACPNYKINILTHWRHFLDPNMILWMHWILVEYTERYVTNSHVLKTKSNELENFSSFKFYSASTSQIRKAKKIHLPIDRLKTWSKSLIHSCKVLNSRFESDGRKSSWRWLLRGIRQWSGATNWRFFRPISVYQHGPDFSVR